MVAMYSLVHCFSLLLLCGYPHAFVDEGETLRGHRVRDLIASCGRVGHVHESRRLSVLFRKPMRRKGSLTINAA